MQYLTLEKESGAIQAVNMGLIGEEVEFPVMDYAGVTEWVKDKLRLKDLGYEDFKIRIPKPTIEDLRVGDIVLMDRKNPFGNGYSWKYSVYIQDKTDYFDICTMYKSGEVKNLKLITRKSEGVDVLEGE